MRGELELIEYHDLLSLYTPYLEYTRLIELSPQSRSNPTSKFWPEGILRASLPPRATVNNTISANEGHTEPLARTSRNNNLDMQSA
jgi:hypothetical protein